MSDFKELGVALKAYRVAANETIEDVSGAIELEPKEFKKIENGQVQPPIDIVGLLVSHFSLRSGEASRLFSLAGHRFGNKNDEPAEKPDEADKLKLPIELSGDMETALYSDGVQVASNKYGTVLTFIQGFDEDNEPIIVSRIGMSREQAKNMAKVLKISLESTSDEKQG